MGFYLCGKNKPGCLRREIFIGGASIPEGVSRKGLVGLLLGNIYLCFRITIVINRNKI